MYGMPQQMSPDLFDPSIFLLSGYLFGMLGMLIMLALGVGLVTLPIFFLVLYGIEQIARMDVDFVLPPPPANPAGVADQQTH